MSLHQIIINIKPFLLVSLLFLAIACSFLLGQFVTKTDKNRHPIIILKDEIGESEVSFDQEKIIFASKNGTKYYYVWCSGSSRIKEENKVWFKDKEEAIARGYERAQNCFGD